MIEYSFGDIFKFDETALFYIMRPGKTEAFKEIKRHKKIN